MLFETNNDISGSLGADVSGQVLGYQATLGFANGPDGDSDLVLTVGQQVLPEPSAFLSLVGGMALLLGLRRRRS